MAVVLLPSILAAEAGGASRFEPDAATVREALQALPVANLVFDERGELRPLVNVYVDGIDVREREGVETALEGGETIRLVAAIAGGSTRSRVVMWIGALAGGLALLGGVGALASERLARDCWDAQDEDRSAEEITAAFASEGVRLEPADDSFPRPDDSTALAAETNDGWVLALVCSGDCGHVAESESPGTTGAAWANIVLLAGGNDPAHGRALDAVAERFAPQPTPEGCDEPK